MINNVNSRQRNSGLCYKLQNIWSVKIGKT
jgi:hypothetical protein